MVVTVTSKGISRPDLYLFCETRTVGKIIKQQLKWKRRRRMRSRGCLCGGRISSCSYCHGRRLGGDGDGVVAVIILAVVVVVAVLMVRVQSKMTAVAAVALAVVEVVVALATVITGPLTSVAPAPKHVHVGGAFRTRQATNRLNSPLQRAPSPPQTLVCSRAKLIPLLC